MKPYVKEILGSIFYYFTFLIILSIVLKQIFPNLQLQVFVWPTTAFFLYLFYKYSFPFMFGKKYNEQIKKESKAFQDLSKHSKPLKLNKFVSVTPLSLLLTFFGIGVILLSALIFLTLKTPLDNDDPYILVVLYAIPVFILYVSLRCCNVELDTNKKQLIIKNSFISILNPRYNGKIIDLRSINKIKFSLSYVYYSLGGRIKISTNGKKFNFGILGHNPSNMKPIVDHLKITLKSKCVFKSKGRFP